MMNKDYYTYGMQMPGRKQLRELDGNGDPVYVPANGIDGYRYGFSSMEKDDEIKGEGNSLDFGARLYDPRVGRWLSIDPLASKFPHLTPYSYVGGMVNVAIDPDGKDIVFTVSKSEDGKLIVTAKVNAKLVNESNKKITSEQMDVYAQRISQGIEDYWGANKGYLSDVYDDNGNLVSGAYDMVNVEVDITAVSEENPISSDDHVIRIRDKGKILELSDDGESKYASKTAEGYAPEGKTIVYITSEVLDRTPASEGDYANTGLTSDGESSLERTVGHEFGHSAGLVSGRLGHNNVYYGDMMTPSSQKQHAGIKFVSEQIKHIISITKQINDGQQSIPDPE